MSGIIRRQWSNDLYAFYCANEMAKMDIRVVSVLVRPFSSSECWEVWGQHEGIGQHKTVQDLYDQLDRRVNALIDGVADKLLEKHRGSA